MPDPIVGELKAAAEDALSRGFAILTCEPKAKLPWAKYSPHAVNSCTRVPEVALAAWNDGHAANYGIGGEPSNITVVDCDHGLNSIEELEAWRVANNLPETFTVISGREGFGAHLYYSGAVPTCAFKLGNVTGELKGRGGYVVGPGSVHPSGKKYYILKDISVAPLPEELANFAKDKAKNKVEFTPKSEGGELIPAGSRWIHLQSAAGRFRNSGLSEKGIYHALKDFCETNCEDGANYPDEKIIALAEAAVNKFEAAELGPIVTKGSPDPDIDDFISEEPDEVIDGDYLGDLSRAVTDGTFIPPAFARGSLKTMAGAMLDGRITFPHEETLHMRHWNALISARPESGKSLVWQRCMLFMKKMLAENEIVFPQSGFFSSGEHSIKVLAENDNKAHIAYFDEMKNLFEKGSNVGSTLFPKLLELYESKSSATGSVTNTKASFDNVSLSMSGNFTRDGFERAVSGKSAGGNGFLSRMVLEYSNGIHKVGDWDEMDPVKVNTAVENISESIKWIVNFIGEKNAGKPFIPEEDEDALVARQEFQKWLGEQKLRIYKESPEASYCSRLEAHFKRDLLLRVAFTPGRRITKALVERSAAWARHQLSLRELLWPIDSGGNVERFEKRIVIAIQKLGPLTKAGVQKHSNASRCEGGYEAWNRAWDNLRRADVIDKAPQKSHRGKEKFGLKDAIWRKQEKNWVMPD